MRFVEKRILKKHEQGKPKSVMFERIFANLVRSQP
jgi:hypothetical protein